MSLNPESLGPVDGFGWLAGTERVPSLNYDQRPAGEVIRLLVIHAISLPPGVFGGNAVIDFFSNRLDPTAHPYFSSIAAQRVSAHFFIRRDGRLVQFVSCDARAWHAGASCWRGRDRCNDYSIGVELEGNDHSAYSDAQYAMLIQLIDLLKEHYPLEACAGHADIASGRKTDPGPFFDWSRIVARFK